MRILIFVTQFYQPSGAEKLAIELAKELLSTGQEVDLVSMYGESLPGVADAKQKLKLEGIDNIAFLDMPLNPSIWRLLVASFKLRVRVKTHRYDVIEASMSGPVTLACWSTILLKTRVVAGIHAVFDRNMHNTIKHKIWRYSAHVKKNISYYAISNAVAIAWSQYSRIPLNRIHVIYNGISNKYFLNNACHNNIKSELGLEQDSKLILFVGSLVYYKGIDILIEAILPILNEYNCYLLLVGEGGKSDAFYPGKSGFAKCFHKKIEQSGLSKKIIFLGNRDDVHNIMAVCDVLAHPARTEGFGLVLAEALAAGLPIVATDVGGIPEVLENTRSLLVPKEDPLALRKGVLELLLLNEMEKRTHAQLGRVKAGQYKSAHRVNRMLEIFCQ